MNNLNYLALSILLLLTACQKQESVDLEKEKQKVRQVFLDQIKEVEAGNTDGIFTTITDDYISYNAGEEPIKNLDTLRTILDDFFAVNTFKLTKHESQEIIIRDDIAIHRHKSTVIIRPKNDTTEILIPVKYLDVLRKNENGDWKIYIHSVSPNQ